MHGLAIHHGFDRDMHPIMLIQGRLMEPAKWTIEEIEECFFYVLEQLCFIADQINRDLKITFVYDRSGMSRKNINYAHWKFMAGALNKYYIERLAFANIYPLNLLFKIGWAIVKFFIDPRTKKKM